MGDVAGIHSSLLHGNHVAYVGLTRVGSLLEQRSGLV